MSKMCALVGAVARPESVYAKTAVKSESVYVNPTAVRYVRPGSNGHSLVYFANDQSITVAMNVEEVVCALDVAMNVDHT
jgi:hypothetical protein